MKKNIFSKIGWRGRSRIGLLILFLFYFVWWMRPAHFPQNLPNENLFTLSIQKINSGDSLEKAFLNQEMSNFREKIQKSWQDRILGVAGFHHFPRGIKDVRFLQRQFMKTPYYLKDLQDDVLSGRVLNLTLDEYFSSLDNEKIHRFHSDFLVFSGIFHAIETKTWFTQMKDIGEIEASNNARAYAKALNFFAGYYCSLGDTKLCTQYLKLSYLLGAKMTQRNTEMGTRYGLHIREDALLLMLYLHQQGKLSLHTSELLPLIQYWQLDAEKLTEQVIKADYWHNKSIVESLSFGKFPLFDKEETIKMMQTFYTWQLHFLNHGGHGLEDLAKKMDKRLFELSSKGSWGIYEENKQDDFSSIIGTLGKVFWRKNIVGVDIFPMFSPSVYDHAKVVEDYEWYLLNYL